MANEDHYQPVDLSKAVIQELPDAAWLSKDITTAVLRLDRIHPVVSGNKWFKLKYHLQQALQQQKKGICTFGGAWSNHLVATAFACRQAGLSSIGMIRGEAPSTLSITLQDAQQYGMQLEFVPRNSFMKQEAGSHNEHLLVPMGGQSDLGVKGASEILSLAPLEQYTHIVCAVGTGTMMAGLVQASLPTQQVIGISSLKIPAGIDNSLQRFVAEQTGKQNFSIFFDYHFGGYARKTDALTGFMNKIYDQYQLPTDFVYTGKLLYGLTHLISSGYIPPTSRILVIHSGGLQGNRSLPEGTLTFL